MTFGPSLALGLRKNSPINLAVSPLSFKNSKVCLVSVLSTQTTIPIPQLKVRYSSFLDNCPSCCSQSKMGGHDQREVSISALSVGGSTRGKFSNNPPPVIWASACTSIILINCSKGLT